MSEIGKDLKDNASTILIGLVAFTLILTSLNLFFTMNLNSVLQSQSGQIAGLQSLSSASLSTGSTGTGSTGTAALGQDDVVAQIMAEVIPTGVPDIYGAELGVDFDNVQASLNKLAVFDNSITLTGADEQRYIKAGTSISCEYCCGAQYITTPQGTAACGCAHSAAMRGLAKYLVQNHGSEYTDAEILAEMGKWKAVFFPKQTIQKAIQLKADAGEVSQNVLAGLPDMVGGC